MDNKSTITRQDIITSVSEEFGFTKACSKKVVEHILDTVQTAVTEGKDVRLTGFGTFKRVTRSERSVTVTGFDKSKEAKKIVVPAHYGVKFDAGSGLKADLDKAYKAK